MSHSKPSVITERHLSQPNKFVREYKPFFGFEIKLGAYIRNKFCTLEFIQWGITFFRSHTKCNNSTGAFKVFDYCCVGMYVFTFDFVSDIFDFSESFFNKFLNLFHLFWGVLFAVHFLSPFLFSVFLL